jgi:PleD family two-component response regulator
MQSKMILIVDDETTHIEVLFSLVQSFSTVVFARSIIDAKNLIERRRPDLILLDNQVRDGYGIQFCRELKQSELTQHIPIIVVTASDDADLKLLAFENGAIDFITKPIDGSILKMKIKNILETIEYSCLRFGLPEVVTQ